ncbi:trigger factor [Oryzomicrobium terrae]|uniref:Trigger factor n=1 Tax=Oryzomicrobium terrae TaxID=1735038 RepID=A0A5C1E6V4_9RHOO|nr:trigger factor [Oryzomicrobium terrae]QEL64662.1 trigger factor [Oryzomicrobium terrae]
MENTQVANALERRLDLTINVADLDKDADARLKKLGRTVKMAGFRPGKVPFNMVKQQHGHQARHEALTEALDRAFGEAVAAQNLRVAGYPRIEPKDSADEALMAFTAVFEVYPEFKIADLSGKEIERPVLEVTAAEVDQTLEILRKQRVHYKNAERGAQKDDRVVIDFLGKKDGVPFDGGQASDYPFVLGQGMMLGDFETAVEGCKVGESKTFDLTFPADYFAKDLAGQTVQFEITVKQVQEPVLPEVDGEFAKMMGIADGDVEKMRAEVETNLKREVKKRIEARIKDQVMDALVETNAIDVPNALVEMEVQRLMQAARADMESRGIKADQMPVQPEWFAEQAKRRVTLGLILAELVKTEGLEAKMEQVKAKVEEAAQSYENPEEVVRWYFSNPRNLAEVEAITLEDNVVQWVLAKAKAADKAVSFDELMGAKA